MRKAPDSRYVIDLFAGAGGLSLGAARAGFSIKGAVELEPHALSTHIANFPNTKHIQADISKLKSRRILRELNLNKSELCGIIGGPPCQGFSHIGHRNLADERNNLFVRFFDIVRLLQPVFYVAENVPGILDSQYDNIRTKALGLVSDYVQISPMLIKASDYGAPTIRTRVFFIGYKKSYFSRLLQAEDFCSPPQGIETNVERALAGLPQDIPYTKDSSGLCSVAEAFITKYQETDRFFESRVVGRIPAGIGNAEYIKRFSEQHIVNGFLPTKHSVAVKSRYSQLEWGKQDKISKSVKLNPNGFCPTLRAGTGPEKGSYQAVRPIHYSFPRVITPREAARLQGFPDWFMLPQTIWHGFRQIGNSVSPLVAEYILRVIYDALRR